VIALIEPVAQ